MKELLTYIAQNLVDDPEAVRVEEIPGENETVLQLRVGRQGRIAKEIRTLMRSVAQHKGQRVTVDIVD